MNELSQDVADQSARLRRSLTLPLLVFYGLGVTIGAGIFALIGEVLGIAGDHAPLAFLLAGLIAGATGVSYAVLVRRYPLAGGEAVFVNRGIGQFAGMLAGYGVCATGIISSAVIVLAFVGYVQVLFPVSASVLIVGIVFVLTAIAWYGIRESVWFAALITLLELGTLAIVIVFGLPLIVQDVPRAAGFLVPKADAAVFAGILSGAVIAFFAFVGFEDIENLAEETVQPQETAPRAIYWTLGVTVTVYVLLAIIAAAAPDRVAITGSTGPMAQLFEQVSGLPGQPVAAMAAAAMINGILVQIVMASRVLYGMSGEGLAPSWLAHISPSRQTPSRATLLVGVLVLVLALLFPILRLAELTSLVTLGVFALVNLSLFLLGGRTEDRNLRRLRWWGLLAAGLCVGIAGFQLYAGISGAH